jgi:hypothetical protein
MGRVSKILPCLQLCRKRRPGLKPEIMEDRFFADPKEPAPRTEVRGFHRSICQPNNLTNSHRSVGGRKEHFAMPTPTHKHISSRPLTTRTQGNVMNQKGAGLSLDLQQALLAGIPTAVLVQKLREGLEATVAVTAEDGGTITDARVFPDYPTRLLYLERIILISRRSQPGASGPARKRCGCVDQSVMTNEQLEQRERWLAWRLGIG